MRSGSVATMTALTFVVIGGALYQSREPATATAHTGSAATDTSAGTSAPTTINGGSVVGEPASNSTATGGTAPVNATATKPSPTTKPSTPEQPSPGGKSGTFTGSSVPTRYGPVQVRIVVSNNKITSAQAIAYPNRNPKDVVINARAIPQLNSQAVQAQSAQLSGVSGATYTSQGYRTSLQAAIDQAGL